MKTASPVLASLLVLTLSFAHAGEPGTYEYQTYDNIVTITGYEPDGSSELMVPAEIEGLPVMTIGWEAFKDCKHVTRIVLPENITAIQGRAFFNCTSLTSVALPADLAQIGQGAFFNCRSLAEVAIPDAVTTIGNGAFLGTGLTRISIPAGVTEIGAFAFARCAGLEAIDVQAGSEHFASVDGVLFDAALTTLYRCPEGRAGNYIIPQGVTSLAGDSCSWCYPREGAFENCELLDSISLPSSLTSIGAHTFRACSSLASLTISEQVAEIDPSAFDDCPALAAIDVAPQNLHYSGIMGLLLNGDGTELIRCLQSRAGHLDIPAGVTVLGSGAFTNCAALTSVNVPEGVAAIHSSVFTGCAGLERIQLPASLTELLPAAFSSCPRLTAIEVAEDSANFASVDGALYDREMTSLLFCPRGRTGSYAIPEGVETVSWSAFEQCVALIEVVLPGTLTSIEGRAFYGCSALRNIRLPDSVSEIHYEAFRACTALVEINIPRNVRFLDRSTFIGNTSLEAIHVAPGNEDFSSVDGVLFNADGTTLIRYPRAKPGDYTVPDGVMQIRGRDYSPPMCATGGWGWGWWWESPYADVVRVGDDWVLPEDDWEYSGDPYPSAGEGEEDYDYYQYYYGEGAFEGCHGLTGISIPDGVVSIGHLAFYRATGLSSVTLPTSVDSLGNLGLANNDSLREVRFTGDVPIDLGWQVFEGTAPDLAIHYRLKVVSIVPADGSSWDLQWTSIPGDFYAVEVSEDLQNWTTVETDILGWGPRGYYRVATAPELGACYFRVLGIGRE